MGVRPVYLTQADADARWFAGKNSVLGVIGFGVSRPVGLSATCPFTCVELPPVSSGPCYEVWTGDQPADWRQTEDATLGIAGEVMFGVLHLDGAANAGVQDLARQAYARLFTLCDAMGFAHVVRVFNYLPRITALEHGTERYRQFNAGRHEAFLQSGRAIEAAPAACALGMMSGPPIIYFVASSVAGRPVENPRQVSAYRYPAQYGRRSPSFSRAMLLETARGAAFFISGTASIVGHESMHEGDVAMQAAEISRNFAALFSACGDLRPAGDLMLKVYLRDACDVARVSASLPAAQVMYLQADICRTNLLVEIEGFCGMTRAT